MRRVAQVGGGEEREEGVEAIFAEGTVKAVETSTGEAVWWAGAATVIWIWISASAWKGVKLRRTWANRASACREFQWEVERRVECVREEEGMTYIQKGC